MTDMSDSEALDHYRIEVARLRREIRALADSLECSSEATGWAAADDLYRILGERP